MQNNDISKSMTDLAELFAQAIEQNNADLCLSALSKMVDADLESPQSSRRISKGKPFASSFELISGDLTHERAVLFGVSFSKWLNASGDQKLTAWTKNALFNVAKNLASSVLCVNGDPEHLQVIASFISEKRHPDLDRQVGEVLGKGYFEGWCEFYDIDQWSCLVNCMKQYGGHQVIDCFAQLTFVDAFNGNLEVWDDILNVYCPATSKIDPILVESFDRARRLDPNHPNASLFSIMAKGYEESSSRKDIFTRKIQDLIMSDKVDRTALAKHVDGQTDVSFISESLNLNIPYVFGISNLESSAKRAMVAGDLDI